MKLKNCKVNIKRIKIPSKINMNEEKGEPEIITISDSESDSDSDVDYEPNPKYVKLLKEAWEKYSKLDFFYANEK